jgi:predicted TIM-barrel fold metal-dependent hydrolase
MVGPMPATIPSLPSDHFPIISADCHAGGSHTQYREYLQSDMREEFDAWRGEYRNPFRDLGDTRKLRNWDDEIRNSQQEADGVVAEVTFPNTVPPFFPSFVLFAGPPQTAEDYRLRRAGIHAHNRWLVDWCNRFPTRRAGIGQIFINDLDDAIEDATWIAEQGLRGGVLLPNIAPDAPWIKPLSHPDYEPLWSALEDLDVPVNIHGGTGIPSYPGQPSAMVLLLAEVHFYAQRPLVHMLLSGVFERHPRLKVVMTESGASWLGPLVERLDSVLETIRDTGATGELRFGADAVLPRSATEYVQQNLWLGISQPDRSDFEAEAILGRGRLMWGSDYPHDEGTHPFSVASLRALTSDFEPDHVFELICGNAADLYDFDVATLQPLADQHGPTFAALREPLTQLPKDANDALPIYLVVFKGSYSLKVMGNLILRGASRLDAFSVYPFQT